MKKTAIILAIVLLSVATLSVFAEGSKEKTGEGGVEQVLKYATTSDFDSFHAANRNGGGPSQVVSCIYNGLIALPTNLDELRKFNVKPSLAESWEVSEDGRTWTFYLKEGVQFHHGYGEMTAEDVAFTYREVNIDPSWTSTYTSYEELEFDIVDKYTIRITTPVANPFFLILVSDVGAGNIVSKKAFQEKGVEEFTKSPVGTGPFAFVEHIPNEMVVLERHEEYFEGRPILEKIEFIPMDVNSAELALRKGSVQFLNNGVETEQWLEKMKGYGIEPVPVYRESIMILMLDQKVEPLGNIKVRRAIQHAINKKDIVSLFGETLVREMKGPVPDTFFGATEEVPQYEYNPEKAKQLLAEAGYPNGFTVNVISSERRTILDTMLVLQDHLKKVGINMEMSVYPHSTWNQLIREGTGGMNIRATGRLPFADIILTENFHSDAIVTKDTGIRNMMNYANALVDRNIDAARFELNQDKQKRLYKEALVQIMEDAVAIPLIVRASVVARHPKFDPGYELQGVYQADGHILIDHRAKMVDR